MLSPSEILIDVMRNFIFEYTPEQHSSRLENIYDTQYIIDAKFEEIDDTTTPDPTKSKVTAEKVEVEEIDYEYG